MAHIGVLKALERAGLRVHALAGTSMGGFVGAAYACGLSPDELEIEADPQRLEMELALVAQKLDVDEELDRLESHVVEIRKAMASSKPVGRRLDFLMQEANREANTLCSKAQASALTTIGLDLKAVIDQMREQIQNVE